MKKFTLIIITGLSIASVSCYPQKAPQNQIPSLVLNNFKKEFPMATDVEWEVQGDQYEVEFETGLYIDHDVWYDQNGKIIKHRQDISKKELPETIKEKLAESFAEYRLEDIEKTSTNIKTIYEVDIEGQSQEWELIFDPEGNILQQLAD